uniref:BTB domain-containing protein n=1 Tax=Chromera velia CCMP2878 TaxID=1169474 RepID=A0A0G4F3M8_9ALVE|eukprot:Cvel_15073.t1-p1 / transcript=Cvel_15073.t1 / gene=Cvel_15073 / organism=Chromera_velia_CCMP2878 / gene_product=hypothetical protein / transcript_product=hypothetical protein / location=Cvel_scaffold1099:212-3464(-) / protein_length=641 / sequence_SO=supercontig / SO=protein_coding / is_pseudo=false
MLHDQRAATSPGAETTGLSEQQTVARCRNPVCHLFDDPETHDVELSFEGSVCSLYAHKCILAAGSPVFRAMFYGGYAESQAGVRSIQIRDAEYLHFKNFIGFFYGCETSVDASNFGELLRLACYYESRELLEYLTGVTHRFLSRDTFHFFLQLYHIAPPEIQTIIHSHIQEHLLEYLSSGALSTLPEAIIRSLQLKVFASPSLLLNNLFPPSLRHADLSIYIRTSGYLVKRSTQSDTKTEYASLLAWTLNPSSPNSDRGGGRTPSQQEPSRPDTPMMNPSPRSPSHLQRGDVEGGDGRNEETGGDGAPAQSTGPPRAPGSRAPSPLAWRGGERSRRAPSPPSGREVPYGGCKHFWRFRFPSFGVAYSGRIILGVAEEGCGLGDAYRSSAAFVYYTETGRLFNGGTPTAVANLERVTGPDDRVVLCFEMPPAASSGCDEDEEDDGETGGVVEGDNCASSSAGAPPGVSSNGAASASASAPAAMKREREREDSSEREKPSASSKNGNAPTAGEGSSGTQRGGRGGSVARGSYGRLWVKKGEAPFVLGFDRIPQGRYHLLIGIVSVGQRVEFEKIEMPPLRWQQETTILPPQREQRERGGDTETVGQGGGGGGGGVRPRDRECGNWDVGQFFRSLRTGWIVQSR